MGDVLKRSAFGLGNAEVGKHEEDDKEDEEYDKDVRFTQLLKSKKDHNAFSSCILDKCNTEEFI